MSKFRITKPNGEQTILDTDLSHSVLVEQYGPSTDIQPIVEEVAAPVVDEAPAESGIVSALKARRKPKAVEE